MRRAQLLKKWLPEYSVTSVNIIIDLRYISKHEVNNVLLADAKRNFGNCFTR